MGEHIDNRKAPKHKKLKEGGDPSARANRATFKQYLREIDEELLEAEEEVLDPALDDLD